MANNTSFPDSDLEKLNDLLWRVLGPEGEDFPLIREIDTLARMGGLTRDDYLKLFGAINFYYPRRLAYQAIRDSDDRYKEFSSNNELLLALTSIVDWLANPTELQGGWTNRFKNFLTTNLNSAELEGLLKVCGVNDDKGVFKKFSNVEEFAKYVYDVRSWVIHKAELGGMFPYEISFTANKSTISIDELKMMIRPKDFRRLIWRAIFNHLNFLVLNPEGASISRSF